MSESEQPETHSGNKATERIFAVLSAFKDGRQNHSIVELSNKLGMGRSMVRRALVTLTERGYVMHDVTADVFKLGPKLLELRVQSYRDPSILEICLPFVDRALKIVEETITLSIPAGPQSVIIGGVEPERGVTRRLVIGRALPLHVTAAGRAILAFLPSDEISRYLGGRLQRYTETTITDPARLLQEINSIKDKGFALGIEDYIPGTHTIAFPILDSEGFPHGSLSVIGPRERFDNTRTAALLADLQQLMVQLNRHSSLFRAQNVGVQL